MAPSLLKAVSSRCSLALLVQKYLLTGTKVQILTPEELLQGMGMRMEVDDSIPDLDLIEKQKEEDFDIKQWLDSKNQVCC